MDTHARAKEIRDIARDNVRRYGAPGKVSAGDLEAVLDTLLEGDDTQWREAADKLNGSLKNTASQPRTVTGTSWSAYYVLTVDEEGNSTYRPVIVPPDMHWPVD